MKVRAGWFALWCACAGALVACHGGNATGGSGARGGGAPSGAGVTTAGHGGASSSTAATAGTTSTGLTTSSATSTSSTATGSTGSGCGTGGGSMCYANACPGQVKTMQENRDRLIADLAKRKCTDSCTLWAALNQAERYIFLMDTTYLGSTASRLYPPSYGKLETALDHAVALYSINGPKAGQGTDGSGRGGNDYNRIYLGFDGFAECVMRNFSAANPMMTPMYNQWVKSDDLAGPHAPFTQREMIFWYKAWFDLQSNGPQFHHWHQDSDFSQSGLDARLGVCGVTDRSLTELTIAFDFYHNSDPLGNYATNGGYGWQIVDQHAGMPGDWSYMPTGCPVTAPVNMDPYGGGTFAGMGPTQVNAACVATPLGTMGC
jgi:hypothetical protein